MTQSPTTSQLTPVSADSRKKEKVDVSSDEKRKWSSSVHHFLYSTKEIDSCNLLNFQFQSTFAIFSLLLLRILVGFHHHSGEEDHHGSSNRGAYGGDYEAQRHWMELTYHLPIGDWYYYDLEYWGLDYPPLTAFISYLCGMGSHYFVGQESVALLSSRGYEDPTHKAYMRATVLFLDFTIYFSAVWVLATSLSVNNNKVGDDDHHTNLRGKRFWTILVLSLLQPSLILIDHGHFQYNAVSLGLTLWSFYFMTKTGNNQKKSYCVWGSILFCLALNFKQMTLYYAPAVFFYLLGRCFARKEGETQSKLYLNAFGNIFSLGITVIMTFFVQWYPFILFRKSYTTPKDAMLQVLKRIFPVQRGLFEGKVSNIWCALSVKPISIRDRLSSDAQLKLSLLCTTLLIAPFCIMLFNLGMKYHQRKKDTDHLEGLLWGSFGTSLSFFLASFQVHEKSILMAVSSVSVMVANEELFVCWFSVVATWSMWHLLRTDRLEVPYFICIFIFIFIANDIIGTKSFSNRRIQSSSSYVRSTLKYLLVPLTSFLMISLHFAEMFVHVPSNLPDLFPLMWSITGCFMFGISWIYACYILLYI